MNCINYNNSIKTTLINKLSLIEIDDFFSISESKDLLSKRISNFKSAQSHYPCYYRNNDRLLESNSKLAELLFTKLKKLNLVVLEDFKGVNSLIRFCRYQKNQQFSLHQDGVHHFSEKQASKYTLLLYLNHDDFTGGNTEFYTSKQANSSFKVVKPKQGKLLIFDHQIWHQGAIVTSGNKYVLRSDIYIEKLNTGSHHQGYIWNLLKVSKDHFFSGGRDATIKLWNRDLELQNSFKLHTNSVLKIVKLNASTFVSCSRDFTLKKWTILGKLISSIKLDEMVLNIIIQPKKQQLIAVGTSGVIYVLNYDLAILKEIKVHKGWIWDLTWFAGNVVSCGEDGALMSTNLQDGTTNCLLQHHEPLFSICPISKGVYLGSKSGELLGLLIIENTISKIKLHKDIIRTIKSHNQFLFTSGEDNTIIKYNLNTGAITPIMVLDNFVQDLLLLDGKLYAAGFDGMISVSKL